VVVVAEVAQPPAAQVSNSQQRHCYHRRSR
jgi:hypothetical protein